MAGTSPKITPHTSERMAANAAAPRSTSRFGLAAQSGFVTAPAIQSRAPWVPPAVAELVHRALSIPREARFGTAHEMAAALLALIPGGSTQVTEASLVPLADSARAEVAPKVDISSVTVPPEGHSNSNLGAFTDAAMARPIDAAPRNGKLGMILVGMGFLGASAVSA